jgi:hypothetical protein
MTNNVIPFCPPGMRVVWPAEFLRAPNCQAHWILTASNLVTDAHEREAIRAGVQFVAYGYCSADDMIGSRTTRGRYLMPHERSPIGYWRSATSNCCGPKITATPTPR